MKKFNWKDCYTTYINLDRSTIRNEKMIAELNRVGIKNFNRFNALKNNDYAGSKLNRMYGNGNGTVGCTISHLTILENCLEMGRNGFIMEDDLVFATDSVKRLDTINEFLSENEWDIFFLGGTYHINPSVWHNNGHTHKEMYNCDCKLGRDAELTNNKRIIRTYGCWCTYAYIVNVDSIEKILRLTNDKIENTYALDQCWIKIQPELNCFAYLPALAKQYDEISDVQGTFHQFSNFSNLGEYWWQDLEEQFEPSNFNWNEAKNK